ncbi:MAG TPA: histidine phosphatase family protein [Candidatus Paceibacterota bacterium]|nr:histidine phosphatase family protein [Candidatus Paceibacterota bacterium]
MKTIYLVRHGESEANAIKVHASSESPLTQKGHEQAEFIAERAMKLPLDIIVASTMTRAQQTAQHIADKTGRVITSSALFVEGRNASELIGISEIDGEGSRIQKIIDDNFYNNKPRYSDEEDFAEVTARVSSALKYLEDLPHEHILVVTHGWFLKVLLAYALFGKDVTPRECGAFVNGISTKNTGLSILVYDSEKNPSWPWSISVINDHAHLG